MQGKFRARRYLLAAFPVGVPLQDHIGDRAVHLGGVGVCGPGQKVYPVGGSALGRGFPIEVGIFYLCGNGLLFRRNGFRCLEL